MSTQTWSQLIRNVLRSYPSPAQAANSGNFLPLYEVFFQMNPDKCEAVPTWKASVRKTVAALKSQKVAKVFQPTETNAAPKSKVVKTNSVIFTKNPTCHRVGCPKVGIKNGRCKEHYTDNLRAVATFRSKTEDAVDLLTLALETCGKAAFSQAMVKVDRQLKAGKIKLPKIYRRSFKKA